MPGPEHVDPYDATDPHLWVKLEHVGRYCFAADVLKVAPPGVHLDVGCSTGYGLMELEPVLATAVGIDYDPTLLEVAVERLPGDRIRLVQADIDIEALPNLLGECLFDSVTAFEVLEHLQDPARTLSQIRQCLRPEGLLLASVPNARFETGREADSHHHKTFQAGELAGLLTRLGFRVEQTLGQGTVNRINRRETRLVRQGRFDERPSALAGLHSPDIIRKLALVLAYPDNHDVDWSYSHVVVARAC